jgi:hypothetical protein
MNAVSVSIEISNMRQGELIGFLWQFPLRERPSYLIE